MQIVLLVDFSWTFCRGEDTSTVAFCVMMFTVSNLETHQKIMGLISQNQVHGKLEKDESRDMLCIITELKVSSF